MQELFSFQNNLLSLTDNLWHRYLYPELKKDIRLLGLKGLRGVGKTNMLLQYLAHDCPEPDRTKENRNDNEFPFFSSAFIEFNLNHQSKIQSQSILKSI